MLSGNDLLSQRLSPRQVRGHLLGWDCHFCLTAGQKEFVGAVSVPAPHITGQRTHPHGTGKRVPAGTFHYAAIHAVGWEGNGARSLIISVTTLPAVGLPGRDWPHCRLVLL